jgi:lipopolysaccharide export system protein LptC
MAQPAKFFPSAERLIGAAQPKRRFTPGSQARRRFVILIAKFILPLVALALLTTMAIWPDLTHTASEARMRIKELTSEFSGATLIDARYHGVDQRDRPFTVTAAKAAQAGPDRIKLSSPQGDITLQNGTWLTLKSRTGVYRQNQRALDLSDHVFLYRDDGTTLRTQSASIDLKAGAAAGSQPVHAEGPFGILDASSGFTLLDKGEQVEFLGPAHLLLNGANAQ